MADQLEDFISKNRGNFDDDHSENGWLNIEKNLNKSEKKSAFWLWKAAAIVLFFFSVSLLIDRDFKDKATLESVPQIDQIEIYYTTLINQHINQINQFGETKFTIQFQKEINNLDSSYQELKKTYSQTSSTEIVSAAMINNLQLRINLLTQQLEILQQLNKNQDEKAIEI
jgi:hypothetical protein